MTPKMLEKCGEQVNIKLPLDSMYIILYLKWELVLLQAKVC